MGSAGTYPAKPFSTQAVLTECGIPFGVGHGLHSLRVTNHLGQAKEVVRVQFVNVTVRWNADYAYQVLIPSLSQTLYNC